VLVEPSIGICQPLFTCPIVLLLGAPVVVKSRILKSPIGIVFGYIV